MRTHCNLCNTLFKQLVARNTSKRKSSSPHKLFYFFLLFLLFPNCSSQELSSVLLNSSATGSTEGAPIGLFTSFHKLDIRRSPVGRGGQRVLELNIPSELSDTDITISTCQGSDFDTYIALLDGNPQLLRNATAVSESDNDINCDTGRNKAFLSTKLSPGQYFLLVTGNDRQEGNFTVSVTAASATPPPVPWGLDRVDQRRLPLDGNFDVKSTGGRVWIYLIDSGVRTTHEEFEGRAESGYDFVNNREAVSPDCTGHGTHVAGIIAGKTYGISKQARLVSVRAFDCDNTARVSAIVDALGWALIDARFKERTNAVIAMMFSTTAVQSSILQSAVLGLQRSGVAVVVPAGNNGDDACAFYPGSLETFLTVGSTGRDDARSKFSNSGNCTKIYAPGEAIVSSWHNSDNSWRSFSGTAQAAAHVTGVVSNLMHLNPRLKADAVNTIIESISTLDVVGNVAAGESTRFAFVRSVPEFTGNTPPPEKEVYLFAILKFQAFSCSEEAEEVETIKKVFAEELDIKSSQVVLKCMREGTDGSNANSRLLELRLQVAERRAAADFVLLENLLRLGKAGLQLKLGLSFDVVEEPWAVDSTLIVFWGAPTFSDTESSSLSSGAIAGIVVGVLFLLSVILMIIWIAYRRYAKLDLVESMEGSGDFEKGPVHFKDFENSGGSSMMMRSFRNVIKSMSFKRPGGMRHSSNEETDKGINRMGSFIGGPREKIGKDMVRVESFGGEAFAGLTSLLKTSSKDIAVSEQGSVHHDLSASFRGANNLVVKCDSATRRRDFSNSDFDGTDEEYLDESLRMHSFSGEALVMIGVQPSIEGRKSTESSAERTDPDKVIMRVESYKPEVLADSQSDHTSSFFSPE